MTTLIIAVILSFFITFLLLPVIIKVAANRKIFVARQFRKVHLSQVSALGGIAIFIGVIFVMLFFSNFNDIKSIRYYLAAGTFIFLIGLRDDLKEIKPSGKLLGQIVAALIIIFPGQVIIEKITFFSGELLINYSLSIAVTLFIVIWFINAYNFFDGIDMQAAITAIAILAPAGIWFYFTRQYNFSLLLLSTSASLIAFLIFNYSPSKIFMGDTGTVTIGFIIAFAFIKFTNLNLNPSFADDNIRHPFLFGLLTFQLPLFDSLRVAALRLFRLKSPFKADKNHFHHLCLKIGWPQTKIAIFTGSYTLITIIINYQLFKSQINMVLVVLLNLLLLTTVYSSILFKLSKQGKSKLKSI